MRRYRHALVSLFAGLSVLIAGIAFTSIYKAQSPDRRVQETELPESAHDSQLQGTSLYLPASSVDLGRIDIGGHAQHEFLLVNDGADPLSVEVRDASCNCPHALLRDNTIQPGESTTLYVELDATKNRGLISVEVMLNSDDSQLSDFKVTLNGHIAKPFHVVPPQIHLGELQPGEIRDIRIRLVSGTTGNMEIPRVQNAHEWMEVTILKHPTRFGEREAIITIDSPHDQGSYKGDIAFLLEDGLQASFEIAFTSGKGDSNK